MASTITTEEAQDILNGEPTAQQDVSKHRWYTRQLIVFDHNGVAMGFYYLDPATEMQEGQDTFDDDPVPIFPVHASEIITLVWERGHAIHP